MCMHTHQRLSATMTRSALLYKPKYEFLPWTLRASLLAPSLLLHHLLGKYELFVQILLSIVLMRIHVPMDYV